MLDAHFVIVGAALDFLGVAGYAWHTVTGRTQPNRVTWALWAIAPLIAFAAEIRDGVGLQALLTFTVGFGPLVVFAASFASRGAYARITRLDMACAACSVAALVLWAVTRTGTVAVALSVMADAMAAVPTLIKSWRRPDTEHPGVYILGALGAALTLLTVTTWSIDLVAFPLYVMLLCLGLSFVIPIRSRRYSRPPLRT